MPETLPKSERLSGLTAVSALFERGKGLSSGCLRCKYIPRDRASAPLAPEENYFSGQCPKNQFSSGNASLSHADASRIVVSVPKRLFKRAVKRNLLKRRIREPGTTTGEHSMMTTRSERVPEPMWKGGSGQ